MSILFFEILQVALGYRDTLSRTPTKEEWNAIYEEAEKQAISGVSLKGIERLISIGSNKDLLVNMPEDLFLQWIGGVECIKAISDYTISQTIRLCDLFYNAGFRTCLLKGVGNKLFYKGLVRTPGDIDLWVMPEGTKLIKNARWITQDFVHTLYPDAKGEFVHMAWPWAEEPVVEIHFTPSMDTNPWVDRRLQLFFEECAESCFSNKSKLGFAVPTNIMNGVFLLHHIKRHFIFEGIGLRHIVDYILFIQSLSSEEIQEIWDLLGHFKLKKFAGAIKYVMSEMLECNSQKAPIMDLIRDWPVNRRLGRYLYREVLEGGNFGHYNSKRVNQGSFLSRWKWFLRVSINRFFYFPSDAFWSLFMRIRIGISNLFD